MAATTATTGFFDGWNADKVLGLGLEAFNTKVASDQAKATKAQADSTAALYAAQAQKTAPTGGQIIAGFDNKIVIGGGVALLIAVVLLAKGL